MTAPTSPASGALPALPEAVEFACVGGVSMDVFSAEQMREFGNQQFNAGREFEADRLAALASREASPDVLVDMVPPATARDRWMYEQGRLAERDPRTPKAAALASPQVAPARAPAAWLRNDGGDAWTDAKKSNAIDTMGHGGKVMAATFDRPLYLAAPAPVAPTPDLSKLTDEQIADAIECEFSETHEWPEGDAATFRAILKHVQVVPTPAQPSEDARDAARYRWIESQAAETREGDFAPTISLFGLQGAAEEAFLKFTNLGEAIDAAMSATLPSEPEGETP